MHGVMFDVCDPTQGVLVSISVHIFCMDTLKFLQLSELLSRSGTQMRRWLARCRVMMSWVVTSLPLLYKEQLTVNSNICTKPFFGASEARELLRLEGKLENLRSRASIQLVDYNINDNVLMSLSIKKKIYIYWQKCSKYQKGGSVPGHHHYELIRS